MKLVNYNRQLTIEWKSDEIFFLVVESKRELRNLIDELFFSVRENTEDWILSDGEEILQKSSWIEMIFSPWMIDLNNKRIQKGLFKKVAKLIHQGVGMDQIQTVLGELRMLLNQLTDELPFGVEYEIEDISPVLKECNIHFTEEEDVLTRLHQYIKVSCELLETKLFVLIDTKNYFSSEEIQVLAREAGYFGCCILCIENVCEGREENLILIDKDLCRIV